ncbi:MFS transporter [Streptomyces sp. B1866]|uniref:MFS transporter n=1 Tax=Streptomyces sp. B1866 TaxID=3075431 RepID=UPI00288D78BC|nr:MFS transporter [Streptomyces sp. B1866]MDT3395886.1 MFS transporter [Streptomyces sp. B1866]
MDRATAHRRRWQILAILCLSIIVIGLDNLILNLALPSIQQDLGASGRDLQWTIDAYTLPFGGLLLLGGGLGDRYGRKRMLSLGLLVFLAFSLAAAFAPDIESLIAARAGMGVGGALIMPATLSIIKDVFPAEEQAKAVGLWAGSSAIGIPLGPVIGGVLLDHFWWGSVFLVNVPVVVLALVCGFLLIPESRALRGGRLDLVGAALSVATLGVLIYGIIEAPREGWGSATTLSLFAAGAALAVAFLAWERRTAHPLIDASLFRDVSFSGGAAVVVCINFCLFSMLFVVTQYLQYVLGHDPIGAGLRLLPSCTLIVAAPIGVQLVERVGVRRTVALGMLVLAAGMGMLAAADASSEGLALSALAVLGVGMGLAMPPCANAILGATPADQAGAGSAVTDCSVQVGGALGIAVGGSVLATSYRGSLPDLGPLPPGADGLARDSIGGATAVAGRLGGAGDRLLAAASEAFTEALRAAMLVSAGVALLGLLLAVAILPRRGAVAAPGAPEETARRKAADQVSH